MRKTIAAVEAEIGISDGIGPFVGNIDDNQNHHHNHHQNPHPKGEAGSGKDVPQDARVILDMARVSIVVGCTPQVGHCVVIEQSDYLIQEG